MGKPLDSSASFLSFSPTGSPSFFYASCYLIYFSFWSLIPFSLPARPVSSPNGLFLIKFFIFLSPFWMGLTNPWRDLGRFSLQSTSPKLSTLSDISPFSTNLFWLASLLASLVGLNLSFVIGALAWFIKSQKSFLSSPLSASREFALGSDLFSLFINDILASLPSSVSCFFMLTIWPFGPPPSPRFLLRWRPCKKL